MKELVTVIIPIYNTELYLPECLESVLKQTYQELQIILIDDGSTDKSGELCDLYAQKDLRIQVIHQKNSGVSGARNVGLECSLGEYILFVDSDDILNVDAIEKLISVASNVDMVVGSCEQIDEFGSPNNVLVILPNKLLEVQEFIECLFCEDRYGYQGYIANKLYKRKVIVGNKIQFDTNVKYNEDRLFLTQYCMYCKKIRMIESIVYYYRQRNNSAQGIARNTFSSAMLTELLAFEKMKVVLKDKYPSILYRICQLLYEKSLYWIRTIKFENQCDRQYVMRVFCENVNILLKSSEKSLYEKIKIVGHYLLRR